MVATPEDVNVVVVDGRDLGLITAATAGFVCLGA